MLLLILIKVFYYHFQIEVIYNVHLIISFTIIHILPTISLIYHPFLIVISVIITHIQFIVKSSIFINSLSKDLLFAKSLVHVLTFINDPIIV